MRRLGLERTMENKATLSKTDQSDISFLNRAINFYENVHHHRKSTSFGRTGTPFMYPGQPLNMSCARYSGLGETLQ